MAKAKVDTNNEYLDAKPEDFSATVQALLADERKAYDELKARKALVLAAVIAEMPVAAGREVKRTAYTAWGQWQIIVGDKVAPKAASNTQRMSLAEYRAAQEAQGIRH